MKAHVEEDRTGFRLTDVENAGMERGRERGNSGRVIGGRGTMKRSEGSPADITSFDMSQRRQTKEGRDERVPWGTLRI